MGKHLNDPTINKTYNYVYKTTNLVNNKIYIGVHRTDNLNDGYIGSGTLLKRSINKYGKSSFNCEIIQYFDLYQDALDMERELVNLSFIELSDNYNLREGGYGGCGWSDEMIIQMSDTAKKLWSSDDHRVKMLKVLRNPVRCKKISDGQKKWIKNNPQKHKVRMNKINHNPEKIRKTAEKHRGMKRSDETKKRQSIAKQKYINEYGNDWAQKGCKYVYNDKTNEIKRLIDTDVIPDGWVSGSGPKNKKSYKNMNKGSVMAHNPDTQKTKRFKSIDDIPNGWIRGLSKKSKTYMVENRK